jgi:acetyl esterase/lipase
MAFRRKACASVARPCHGGRIVNKSKNEWSAKSLSTCVLLATAAVMPLAAGIAYAQDPPAPAAPLKSRQVLPIWEGRVPGVPNPAQHESTVTVPGKNLHITRNVTVPTLTVFPAKSAGATKTAVIIAPGGGFRVLAVDQEGYSVAEWLSQRGITAFVLKYRLAFTPGTDREFAPNLLSPPIPRPSDGKANPAGPPGDLPQEAQKNGIADGIQAIKVVRAGAAQWGISPEKIVFIGFSAGGVVTSGTMLAPNAADRPNFAAPIYGAPFGVMPNIPTGTPPTFLAVAEDDPLAGAPVLKFFEALRAAKGNPELHVFRSGMHGFSMMQRNTTSDHWIEELYWWLESYGLTQP